MFWERRLEMSPADDKTSGQTLYVLDILG